MRLRTLWTAGAALLLLAAPVWGQSGAPPRSLQVPGGAIVAAGKAPSAILLFSGDVIGYLEDCGCKQNPAGGLARRQWLKGQIESNFPGTPVVFLDTGNFSDNPNEVGEIRTKGLLEGMNRLGYRVVNAAERDLSLGLEVFRERTRESKARFVSANIVRFGTKEPVLEPYAIVEVAVAGRPAPLRIGVLGAVRFNPVWKKPGPDGTSLVIVTPKEMIARYLPEVRAKADVVVLLAAMSRDDAGALAREVPGIDFAFGAYGGMISTQEEIEGGAQVVYVGNQGQRIGETRLFLDERGAIASTTTYLHFLTARYPSDPAMEAFVGEVAARAKGVPGSVPSGTH